MRVELMARQAPAVPRDRVTTSKMLAGLAPVVAVLVGIVAARASQDLTFVLVAVALSLVAVLGVAYAPFGQGVRSITTTVAFLAAFAVEVVVGAFGILATAGIGYAIVGILAGVGVVRFHTRQLHEGGGGPSGPAAPQRPGSPPPPLPRPPSSEE